MKNNQKAIEAISVTLISITLVLLISLILIKLVNSNKGISFEAEMKNIYNSIMLKNRRDKKDGFSKEEYTFYEGSFVYEGRNTYKYIAEFNEETNNLEYLCISNGMQKSEMENDLIDLEYVENFLDIETTNKECKARNEE